MIILYLRKDRKPVFNDIFSGLREFTELFPYFLVLLLIFFGFVLLILPGIIFATWWLYVLPLMVDKKMSFTDAMRLSMHKVNETGFLMHLVFLLLVSAIPLILIDIVSTLLPFAQLLKILLPPLQIGCLAGLYIDQFKEEVPGTADDDATEPAPEKEQAAVKSEQEHETEELCASGMTAGEKINRNESEGKTDDGAVEKNTD